MEDSAANGVDVKEIITIAQETIVRAKTLNSLGTDGKFALLHLCGQSGGCYGSNAIMMYTETTLHLPRRLKNKTSNVDWNKFTYANTWNQAHSPCYAGISINTFNNPRG
jgi:hypothetical protein